jgi:virginiamycin A acetyltransferase
MNWYVIKYKLFNLFYLVYSIYPVYLLVNIPRYFLRDISLFAFVFSRQIGKYVSIGGGVFISKDSTIGDYTYISGDNLGMNSSRIELTKIGRFCSIGPHFTTLPYSHDYRKLSTYPFEIRNGVPAKPIARPIIIKDDVWVGSHVIILGGVTVNSGAVLAAGSVVTKDVPAYNIVAGNPAKVIKKRFNDRIISRLLKEGWWDNDHDLSILLKRNEELLF